MTRLKFVAIILTITGLIASLTACNEVDTATAALNDAITALGTQSSAWRQVLTDLESRLTKDAQTTLANEVSNLLAASVANVGGEFRCDMDFIGQRAQGALQNLLDKLTGKPPKPADPHLCTVIPKAIDLGVVQEGRLSIVEFAGYDLSGSAVKFFTSGPAGEQPISAAYVANPAPYSLTLNVANSNGVRFPADTTKVVIRVNGTVLSDISVIAPPLPPPPHPTGYADFTVSVHAPGGNINSQCVKIGDDPASNYSVTAGWRIDRSKGDPGHGGISEIKVSDNQQSISTLREQNYFAKDDENAKVEGTICSAGGWGAGAIFDRVYRVFLIQK